MGDTAETNGATRLTTEGMVSRLEHGLDLLRVEMSGRIDQLVTQVTQSAIASAGTTGEHKTRIERLEVDQRDTNATLRAIGSTMGQVSVNTTEIADLKQEMGTKRHEDFVRSIVVAVVVQIPGIAAAIAALFVALQSIGKAHGG